MDKLLVAYVTLKNLDKVTRDHAQLFTRINIAFGKVKDHRAYLPREDTMPYLENIRKFNPDLEIILSLGGAGGFGFSNMAMTQENRDIFTESLRELMVKYDLDGLDLDWEFPCADWGGDFSPKDKENYSYLLRDMRKMLDDLEKETGKKYILTIAAGVGQWFLDTTNIMDYDQYLDYYNLMTYDLRSEGHVYTGHHTTLYLKKDDVFPMSADMGVDLLIENGVSKDKIIIGAAMYSRYWDKVPDIDHGLLQKVEPGGDYCYDYPKLQDLVEDPSYQRFWDDEAKAPWLYSKEKKKFITYEDAQSVEEKCKYVIKRDLPGLMFWHYVDWPENPLIESMKMLRP